MNELFDIVKKETGWKSPSRLIGEACERYVVGNVRCPRCLKTASFVRYPTNEKFKDVYCNGCFQSFQIKKGNSNSLLGGEYFTTINNLSQVDFLVVKCNSVFHVPHERIKRSMVIPRKPLSVNARRAGWRGCVLRFPSAIQHELLYWKAKKPRSLKAPGVQKVRRSRRRSRTRPRCSQCLFCTTDT